jgi:hypothetical protein
MSPSGQPNSASRRSKIVRQTSIVPIVQTEPGAVGLVAAKKRRHFDPHAFLATIAEGRRFVLFPRKREIFAQGDSADAVFYIQTGTVKLTVVSKTGKEATIGIIGGGDFFGEASLVGQALRMDSATAITTCWRGTSAMKKIWLTSFSIRAKRDWLGSFCCSPALAKKACPRP